jgi:PAS domain S-box-containing protein
LSDLGQLREENAELRRRLAEAEDALQAISQGQVDAIVVDGTHGAQIFSLTGAEHIYRAFVETMREAALTVAWDGTVIFCNEQFCQLMKMPSSDVLGRPLAGFFASGDREQVDRLLSDAGSHAVHRRVVLRDADGTEVPVQVAANLLEAPGDSSICLVAADLTELEASAASIRDLRDHQRAMEKAEAELRASRREALDLMAHAVHARAEAERAATEAERSRERLSLASSAGELGIFEWDVAGDVARWENEWMYRIFGRSAEEGPIGFRAAAEQLIDPRDRPAVEAEMAAAMHPGGVAHGLFRLRRQNDGSERWVQLSGRFEATPAGDGLRFLAVIADVTDRELAYRAADWRRRRDELLSRTAARLLESRDPQALIERLCGEVMLFLDCGVFFNYLVDKESGGLRLNAYSGISSEDAGDILSLERGVAVCGCVARDGERIVAEDIQHSDDPRTVLVKSHGVQAYCCHPLAVQGSTIGTVSFGTRTRPRFAPEEVEAMKSVADLIAMAMNRVAMEEQLQLSEERFRILFEENERLYRQQLSIAETLQAALVHLPKEVGPVRLAHLYRSATETARVGGDFYDVFRAKNGKVVVVIGDVSGHGVEAARVASLTKDVIRAFATVSLKPNYVLARANRLLIDEGFVGFVTVFLGVLDAEREVLRYASAGHPDAMLRRPTGEVQLLWGHSSPLAVHADATWITKQVEARPGDVLFLYTDGVTEARQDHQMFGDDRLQAMVKRQGASVEELPQAILDEVLEFSGHTLNDDLAMVAISLVDDHLPADSGPCRPPFAQESLID